MALWVIAILLLPVSLNELDKLSIKIYKLYRAIKRKRKGY